MFSGPDSFCRRVANAHAHATRRHRRHGGQDAAWQSHHAPLRWLEAWTGRLVGVGETAVERDSGRDGADHVQGLVLERTREEDDGSMLCHWRTYEGGERDPAGLGWEFGAAARGVTSSRGLYGMGCGGGEGEGERSPSRGAEGGVVLEIGGYVIMAMMMVRVMRRTMRWEYTLLAILVGVDVCTNIVV